MAGGVVVVVFEVCEIRLILNDESCSLRSDNWVRRSGGRSLDTFGTSALLPYDDEPASSSLDTLEIFKRTL
jgi:hypothetical protein